MRTVTAACYLCGPVSLPAQQVHLVLHDGDRARFEFQCPGCGCLIVRAAEEGDVARLTRVGVIPEQLAAPVTGVDAQRFARALDALDPGEVMAALEEGR